MTDQSGLAVDQTYILNEAARLTGLTVDALRQPLYHQTFIDFRRYLEMALFEPRPSISW